jgi:PPOX class probable F420-dependent enzyme
MIAGLSAAVSNFLREPRMCVMATINRDGTPQLTVMWYDLSQNEDFIVLNTIRGLVKEHNLRRDPRMAVCIEDGQRYVTVRGRADIVEDRALQEVEVNRMAVRYRGPAGTNHWQTIAQQDRLGIHMHIERVQTRGF